LAAQTSETILITLELVPCSSPGAYRNTAEVESMEDDQGNDVTGIDVDSQGDDDPGNDGDMEDNDTDNNNGDEDDSDFEELEIFDLALIKQLVTEPMYENGDILEYAITVVNQGNVPATDIIVWEHLPPGVTSGGINSGWTGSHPSYAYTITSTLNPSDTIVLTFYGKVNFIGVNPQDYVNYAEIGSARDLDGNTRKDADSNPDNNPDNDGNIVDDQLNDKGDEDDHDPEGFEITQLLPPDCYDDCQISCVHEINFSLDNSDCEAQIFPSTFIAGLDPVCDYSGFYELILTDEEGNVIDPAFVTAEHIGQKLTFRITNACGNSCWGYLNVESKQGPVIDCPSQVVTDCVLYEVGCPTLLAEVQPGCNGLSADISLSGETFEFLDCGPYSMEINRSYRAVDELGNESSCDQKILLERLDTSEIIYPLDATITCGDDSYQYDSEGHPLPWKADYLIGRPSGIPYLVRPFIPVELCADNRFVPNADSTAYVLNLEPGSAVACSGLISYEDRVVKTGPCKTKIMRTWSYQEWSCGTYVTANRIQTIELVDNAGPQITCPADTTLNAMFDCGIEVKLPAATATDDCNAELNFTVTHPSGFSIENGAVSELPLGESLITYIVYDGCDNSSSCIANIHVIDESLPVAICDENTVITINDNGVSRAPAIVFDDGSLDACDELLGCVARMDEVEYFRTLTPDTFLNYLPLVLKTNYEFSCPQDEVDGILLDGVSYISEADLCRPFANFCCTDAGTEKMVIFRVEDPSGNSNQCMASVEIQDMALLAISCPDDVTIDCKVEYDLNDLASTFGVVNFSGSCGVEYPVTENILESPNLCGLGSLVRQLTVVDAGGATLATCDQVITIIQPAVVNDQEVMWPEDGEANCGSDEENLDPDVMGFPELPSAGCHAFAASHEDQFFAHDPALEGCGKILRKWTVIDWCDEVGVGEFATYEYTQIILVSNTAAPQITSQEAYIQGTNNCQEDLVSITRSASDDCTSPEDLEWSYLLIDSDGMSTVGAGSSFSEVLAIGTYDLVWSVKDGCGNTESTTQAISLFNNQKPNALCQSVSISIEEAWMNAKLLVSNIDYGSAHPCGNSIELGFDTISYPDAIYFDCTHVGTVPVTLYVRDIQTDSIAQCTAMVVVQDNDNVCGAIQNMLTVRGEIHTEMLQMVEDVHVEMATSMPLGLTDENGSYAFEQLPMGGSYQIKPEKDDDHMNGVSTLDLILIQRHILGVQQLSSPYQLIAGDVDGNERINGVDLIELRKLILGVYEELPENTSWRFIDKEYDFADEYNPWLGHLAETYDIIDLDSDMDINFIGVKVGDVNGDVETNLFSKSSSVDNRSNRWPMLLQYADQYLREGEIVSLSFKGKNLERISGWQGTMEWDEAKLEVLEVHPAENTHVNLNSKAQGWLTMSHHMTEMSEGDTDQILFELVLRAKTDLRISDLLELSSAITPSEAYRGYSEIVDLRLAPSETDMVQITSVNPNPWITSTTIEFQLPASGNGTWEFYDMNGSLVYELTESYVQGKNTIQIGKKEINTAGVVYVKLTTDQGIAKYKMLILK